MNKLEIPFLAELIAQCWERAEESLRQTVRLKFADRDEEIITELFHSELQAECDKVSSQGAVARAFGRDLHSYVPSMPYFDVAGIAGGLIASVHFHPREVEKRTGGDFGVVLIRPDVSYARFSPSSLEIERDYKRGLLCQAKIFRRNSSWGGLSEKQQEILRARLDYLSLVLYRYLDQHGQRRELGPFAWQLTRGASMSDVAGWLRSDQFPSIENSRHIINALARDQIGTDDKRTIEENVAPKLRPSLEIHIRWRDGGGPDPEVHLNNDNLHVEQHVMIRG
jgi:hypothetical protein